MFLYFTPSPTCCPWKPRNGFCPCNFAFAIMSCKLSPSVCSLCLWIPSRKMYLRFIHIVAYINFLRLLLKSTTKKVALTTEMYRLTFLDTRNLRSMCRWGWFCWLLVNSVRENLSHICPQASGWCPGIRFHSLVCWPLWPLSSSLLGVPPLCLHLSKYSIF